MKDQEVAFCLHDSDSSTDRMSAVMVAKAKIVMMKAYREHLDGERNFQAERIRLMDEALVAAKRAFNRDYKGAQKKIKKRLPGPGDKGQRESEYNAARPVIMHAHYDPVIKTYERAAYFGTISLGRLLSDMGAALRQEGMIMGSVVEAGHTRVSVGDSMGLGSVHVATYYKLDQRFQRIHQGRQGRPSVFQHRATLAEFVQDRASIFVPRYVIRNLAERDLAALRQPAGQRTGGMLSRDGMVQPGRDFDQAVLRHLRAAEQGSSFFVSTTHMELPIFGATGKGFYTGASGQVVIDLAEIPQERIVDTSSTLARLRIMGTSDMDWDMVFAEQDDHYERMAAARDAARTGEVLVHGRIPREAIASFRSDGSGGRWEVPTYARLQFGPSRYRMPQPSY